MKKYTQITLVLVAFFLIVYFRRQSAVGQNLPLDPSSYIPIQSSNTQNIGNTGTVSSPSGNPSSAIQSRPVATTQNGKYKNGIYTGSVEDAAYGYFQVEATITNGALSNITFLQYPNDNNTSLRINNIAMPVLKSEAIKAQSAVVNGVSGASYSSQAFKKSLTSALQKAI